MIFGIKEKSNTSDPYKVFMDIATNIYPGDLRLVLCSRQGHKYIMEFHSCVLNRTTQIKYMIY